MPSLQPPSPTVRQPLSLVPVSARPQLRGPVPDSRAFARDLVGNGGAVMMQSLNNTAASGDHLREHAALPWRMNCDGNLEVMLLRPRRGGSWRVPAARCSGTRTELQSADRAAFQEADITVRVGSEPLIPAAGTSPWMSRERLQRRATAAGVWKSTLPPRPGSCPRKRATSCDADRSTPCCSCRYGQRMHSADWSRRRAIPMSAGGRGPCRCRTRSPLGWGICRGSSPSRPPRRQGRESFARSTGWRPVTAQKHSRLHPADAAAGGTRTSKSQSTAMSSSGPIFS